MCKELIFHVRGVEKIVKFALSKELNHEIGIG